MTQTAEQEVSNRISEEVQKPQKSFSLTVIYLERLYNIRENSKVLGESGEEEIQGQRWAACLSFLGDELGERDERKGEQNKEQRCSMCCTDTSCSGQF